MDKTRITISTTINSTPEEVWEKFTKPEHITQWNFAVDTWHCPKASNDLRPGGKLIATMAAKDGSMSFDFEGEYFELTEQKSMAYRLGDEREVYVTFSAENGNTVVTQIFDAESVNPSEMQKAGWQAILNNFRDYCEKTK